MVKLDLSEDFGFAQIFVLVGMLLVAVSLPVATKLVQQNQENRSNAATKTICRCYVGSSQGVKVTGGSTNSMAACKKNCTAGACKCSTSTVNPATVACTYSYSSWSPSECPSSGKRTRTVTGKSPDGCSGGSPVTSKTCTYEASTDTRKSNGSTCASNSECSSGFCNSVTKKCGTTTKTTTTKDCACGTTEGTCILGNVGWKDKTGSSGFYTWSCTGSSCNPKNCSVKKKEDLVELSDDSYIKEGQPCELTSRCLEGLACYSTGNGKKCQKEKIVRTGDKKINDGCSSDGDCVSPYWCYKPDGKCKVRSGGLCRSSSDCYSNHFCDKANNHCREISSYWKGHTTVECGKINASGYLVKSKTSEDCDTITTEPSTLTSTPTPTPTKGKPSTLTSTPTPTPTPTPIKEKTTTQTNNKQLQSNNCLSLTTSKACEVYGCIWNSSTNKCSSEEKTTTTTNTTTTVKSKKTNDSTCVSTIDSSLFGDINGDAILNSIDFVLVKNSFDVNVACGKKGDINFDGVVNSIDLSLMGEALVN